MRVKIGPYKNWFGPYQLAEVLCFWAKKEKDEFGFKKKPDWVHNFGEWLAFGSITPELEVGQVESLSDDRPKTMLYRFLLWIDSKKKRKIKIHIDEWDTWGMDTTLALIIVPMLKQLKETSHGSPLIDDEDVPKELKSTSAAPKVNEWDTDDNHHLRWHWVLDEIIYSFSCAADPEWEQQFYSGKADLRFVKKENNFYEMINGPNDTWQADYSAKEKAWNRRTNGLRLFGKYYHSLWD
jgi:hypothetical protein